MSLRQRFCPARSMRCVAAASLADPERRRWAWLEERLSRRIDHVGRYRDQRGIAAVHHCPPREEGSHEEPREEPVANPPRSARLERRVVASASVVAIGRDVPDPTEFEGVQLGQILFSNNPSQLAYGRGVEEYLASTASR